MKLSKDEMKNIKGGIDQQPPSNSCNGFCRSDRECDSDCRYCLVNYEGGPMLCFPTTS